MLALAPAAISTPLVRFGRALAPVLSVPMKLPRTTLPVVSVSVIRTPSSVLPEIVLAAAAPQSLLAKAAVMPS